jgi:hypothetical protein
VLELQPSRMRLMLRTLPLSSDLNLQLRIVLIDQEFENLEMRNIASCFLSKFNLNDNK